MKTLVKVAVALAVVAVLVVVVGASLVVRSLLT